MIIQPCGHPASAIAVDGTTYYCGACKREMERNMTNRLSPKNSDEELTTEIRMGYPIPHTLAVPIKEWVQLKLEGNPYCPLCGKVMVVGLHSLAGLAFCTHCEAYFWGEV